MSEHVVLGALAVVVGVAVGFGLFVPFVALSVRRRGRLTVGRTLLWAAALVYFWALWAYTLLPLPDPASFQCAGVNLNPLQILADLGDGLGGGLGGFLRTPSVQQIVLNVVLFLPLGFFIRVLGGRGVVVALLVGLGVSAFIETTQLTGLWGVYPCAYRVFDVDDLLTNTVGAVLGSLVGLVVPRERRGRADASQARMPHPVTRGRRFLAILCDLIGTFVFGWSLALVLDLALTASGAQGPQPAGVALDDLATLVTAAVWLVVTLSTGRTVGDLVVELRYAGGRTPEWLARPLRFASGVGGMLLLGLLPGAWSLLEPLLFVVGAVTWMTTAAGRGLPGLVTGRRLVDARSARARVDAARDNG